MRKLLKWIFIIMFMSSVLTLSVGGIFYWWSLPKLTGKEKVKGLIGEVTITRDQYGVAHIVADKSDLDAFFALGYAHAQDRFWQMAFDRMVAQGRLSEVFGARTVSEDEFLRTWGFYKAAQTAWPAFSPQSKKIVEAYTAGVNAYIARGHYPIQFRFLNIRPQPWTVIDSIAWQKMMAWDLQNIWEMKLKNDIVKRLYGDAAINTVFPPYPQNAPVILSDNDLKQSHLLAGDMSQLAISHLNDAETSSQNVIGVADKVRKDLHFENFPDKGSNNWVLSGQWTRSGKPILADDPHLGFQAPAVWYLAELKGPHLHVIGATLPGVPGVVIGHNDHIAWGVTNANIDTQDLYVLTPKSKVTVDYEVINVRGKPPVIYPVAMSDRGPVISGVTPTKEIAPRVALQWTALMPNDTTVQSLLEIDYANNWQSFVNALKDFVAPSQNFVYADVDGNIGYYLPGKIPVRHFSSHLPVPDDNAHQWVGYIPFDELPHVYNPKEGFIFSANNRIVDGAYPYALTFHWDAPPYRAERILSLLEQQKPLSMNQCAAIQLDTTTLLWKDLSPILLKTHPLDKESEYALKALSNWNGNANLDSVPATIFAYWYRQLANLTPTQIAALSHYPDPLFIKEELMNNGAFCKMTDPKGCADFLSQSLEVAMQKLTSDMGSDPKNWAWGRMHYAVFSELGLGSDPKFALLWNREIPAPGFLYSINVGNYDFGDMNQYNGVSYREIIDLGNFDNSLYIQPLGQSDDPINPNYQDLMQLWRDGQYLRMSSNPDSWGKTRKLALHSVR